MPSTSTVLLMTNDPVFAHQLRLAVPDEFLILKFQGKVEYKTHAFFVIGTKGNKNWLGLVRSLIQAREKVAVVFSEPSPAGEQAVIETGAVVLRASDDSKIIRTILLRCGFITQPV